MGSSKDGEEGAAPVLEGDLSETEAPLERALTFRVANVAAVGASYALLAILFALFVTAVARWMYVGNTHWLSDVAKLGLFGTTVLGAGRVAASGDNIAFSLLRNSSQRVQDVAKLLVHCITLVIAILMLCYGAISTYNVRGITSPTLLVSRSWFIGFLPVAFALVAVVEFGHLRAVFNRLRNGGANS